MAGLTGKLIALISRRKFHFSFLFLERSIKLCSNRQDFYCFFSIPRLISIMITQKFRQKILGQKLKKKARVIFFNFWPKILFEILSYYGLNSLRYAKKDYKCCLLPYNLIKRPKNTNRKCDFRRLISASFSVGVLPSSGMNILYRTYIFLYK